MTKALYADGDCGRQGISERAARSAAGGDAGHGPCEAATKSWRCHIGFWLTIGYLGPIY